MLGLTEVEMTCLAQERAAALLSRRLLFTPFPPPMRKTAVPSPRCCNIASSSSCLLRATAASFSAAIFLAAAAAAASSSRRRRFSVILSICSTFRRSRRTLFCALKSGLWSATSAKLTSSGPNSGDTKAAPVALQTKSISTFSGLMSRWAMVRE